jgi:hypothetical protein
MWPVSCRPVSCPRFRAAQLRESHRRFFTTFLFLFFSWPNNSVRFLALRARKSCNYRQIQFGRAVAWVELFTQGGAEKLVRVERFDGVEPSD